MSRRRWQEIRDQLPPDQWKPCPTWDHGCHCDPLYACQGEQATEGKSGAVAGIGAQETGREPLQSPAPSPQPRSETAREHVANALQVIYFEFHLKATHALPDELTIGVTRRLEAALREIDAGNVAPNMKGVPRQ